MKVDRIGLWLGWSLFVALLLMLLMFDLNVSAMFQVNDWHAVTQLWTIVLAIVILLIAVPTIFWFAYHRVSVLGPITAIPAGICNLFIFSDPQVSLVTGLFWVFFAVAGSFDLFNTNLKLRKPIVDMHFK